LKVDIYILKLETCLSLRSSRKLVVILAFMMRT